jgi:hypothetical protein
MSFPFSVLQTKKEKSMRITQQETEISEVRNIKTDFDKKIEEFAKSGLVILNRDDLGFVAQYPNYFYRNNIMILILTLNLRRDSNFAISPEFERYREKILEGITGVDRIMEANEKLMFEIETYGLLIENTIKKIQLAQQNSY